MAHALFNYDGKCKNIHGHSYKLEVSIIGTPLSDDGHAADGLIIDFGDLKKIVNTQVVDIFGPRAGDKNCWVVKLTEALDDNFERLLYVDYQPTCENLIADFADKIKNSLPKQASLHHLILHETATAYCEWYAEDQ